MKEIPTVVTPFYYPVCKLNTFPFAFFLFWWLAIIRRSYLGAVASTISKIPKRVVNHLKRLYKDHRHLKFKRCCSSEPKVTRSFSFDHTEKNGNPYYDQQSYTKKKYTHTHTHLSNICTRLCNFSNFLLNIYISLLFFFHLSPIFRLGKISSRNTEKINK